jgi:hypothetical protein
LHVQVRAWGEHYPKLIERLLKAQDEELLDFHASRLLTRGNWWGEGKAVAEAERLADYYQKLKDEDSAFSLRAAQVLGQVPAYTIYRYNDLIRKNRLARLLFERSASDYLSDPASMQDLVEASEIHVQALAYRVLALDDERARYIAAHNMELLLGTLLRPLHRTTRALAFHALRNAATTHEIAQRILTRAREAMDLPDRRYPKEELVGLIGQVLHKWPELRSDREKPLVYEMSRS